MSGSQEPSFDLMHARLRALVRSRVFGLESEPVAIGKYRVLRLLGSGGLGVVYLGYDPELDRRVAIKLLRPDRSGVDDPEEAKARLLREAQATAKLSHPNVVHVYEVGEHADRVFLAMQFVDGRTLRRWIKARAHSWRRVVATFTEAGAGLAAAHAVGLVHRDFKPDNVLVSDDGRAFVVDFGLATATASNDEIETAASDLEATPNDAIHELALTSTGALVGTPAYMAPEQFHGGLVDGRSDQFSFCVALWEALFGERPFAGRTVREVAAAVCSGETRSPDRARAVPSWVRDALRRGLSVDPQARHPSMEALLALLSGRRRATRVRVGAAALVALAGVGGIGWTQLAQARHRAGCETASTEIDDDWNDDVALQLSDALVGTGTRYAQETATRVHASLDKYAASWTRVRARTCLAQTGDDAATLRLADATTHCLQTRRESLRNFVQIVKEGDASVVPRAVGASQALPPVSQCEDTGWLLTQAKTPEDEQTRREVEALEPQLNKAWSLENAGRLDAAFETISTLAPDAEATNYLPFIAEVQTQLGSVEARRGHPNESRTALERGFYAALQSGDDLSAAEAATELVWTIGYELKEYDRAMEWVTVAETLLVRLGEPEGVQMAALLDTAGCVRDIMGDSEASARDLLRALRMRLHAFGPEHQLVAVTLGNLGLAHHSLGNLDTALEYRTHALEIFERLLGTKHPFTAGAINGVSVLQLEQGHLQEALAGFRRSHEIRMDVLGEDHPHTAQVEANIANVLQELGRWDEAYAMQRDVLAAYESAYEPGHPQLSSGLLNLASIEIDLGKYADALVHLERAEQIRKAKYPADHPGIQSVRYHIGVAKLWLGEATAADSILTGVLEADATPSDLRESARFTLGMAKHELGETEEGLALVRAAYQTLNDGKHHRGARLSDVERWLRDHDEAGVPNG